MELNWSERYFLATCLLLGSAQTGGDPHVRRMVADLARRLGIEREVIAVAADTMAKLDAAEGNGC